MNKERGYLYYGIFIGIVTYFMAHHFFGFPEDAELQGMSYCLDYFICRRLGLVSHAGHGCGYSSTGRRGPGMLAYFIGHHRRYLYV